MKRTCAVSLFFLVTAAFGQEPGPLPPGRPPGPGQFPAALRLFLELTDAQVELIGNLNADFARLVGTRSRRIRQVQEEIADETAKQPLDPLALGLRYAETETIRRQLVEELARLRARVREGLTEPQRARLRALEDIVKIFPIYSEAIQVNLIEPPGPVFGFGGIGGRSVFGVPGFAVEGPPARTDETP